MTKIKLTKSALTKGFAALLISLLFIELGIWQLHRAQDSTKASHPIINKNVAPLDSIAQAGANLSPMAINRMVEMTGRYVKLYSAPNQPVVNGSSKRKVSLEVRILKISGNRGILVVRGVDSTKSQSIGEDVKVIGRLYPRQSTDVAIPAKGGLTRLDPALVTGDTKLELFDGYVIAQLEQTSYGIAINAMRISAPIQISKVSGYYWQHITYVFIWWLLALMALGAPFYNRLRDKIAP